MATSNYFCSDCGAQVLIATFQAVNPDNPGEIIELTQGRCIVCERVMSFAE